MKNNRKERFKVSESVDLEKLLELHDQIEKDLQTTKKSEDTEDRFETIVYGPFSMTLAHFFIRIGFSANTVTLLSLVFGVFGSFFFYPRHTGLNLIGILIEFFAIILDCADGQVARLTNSSSQLGRFLDGLVDSLNFAAIYIALGLRMMHETIPFTNIRWSWSIWLLIFVSGYCHAEQARMADYYRSLHLHFLHQNDSAFFSTSERIKKELSESRNTPLYNKIYLAVYYLYTRAQEMLSPNTKRLLNAIEENGGNISEELSDAFTSRSRRYVQLTNILTLNLRAYTLFLLILLKLHPWFFPFNVFVLGGIMIFMVAKYEKIAEEVREEFFS